MWFLVLSEKNKCLLNFVEVRYVTQVFLGLFMNRWIICYNCI